MYKCWAWVFRSFKCNASGTHYVTTTYVSWSQIILWFCAGETMLQLQCCRSRIHSLVTRVSELYKISALFHQALCFPPVMWKRGKGLLSGHAVCLDELLSWRKGNGALYCYWADIAVVDKDYPGICFWTDPLSRRHSLKRTAYDQDTLLKFR